VKGLGTVSAGGTSEAASELVMMAAQVLDHPEWGLHRTALTHAAGELIRTQGDEPVLKAIELASDLQVARVIRAAAEAACETVAVSNDGVESRARLFCVPVVARFPEPITTHEFGDHIVSTNWCSPFLARLHECGARHSPCFILPHVFLFDDLAKLSFRDVRSRTALASASSATITSDMISLFPTTVPPQRRSATFLRYLVGHQIKRDDTPRRSAGERARFGDAVRAVLYASMPDVRDVAIVYTERFYEPIWQGLWIYHIHRLAEVVRTLSQRGGTRSDIAASIAVSADRNAAAAQITFSCRGTKVGHHAYLVPLTPLADPKISAGRIAAELRALGVKHHIATAGLNVRTTDGRPTDLTRSARSNFASNQLTMPL
jgi:hypothetical protein